jgi:hypothetical protein
MTLHVRKHIDEHLADGSQRNHRDGASNHHLMSTLSIKNPLPAGNQFPSRLKQKISITHYIPNTYNQIPHLTLQNRLI